MLEKFGKTLIFVWYEIGFYKIYMSWKRLQQNI